VAQGDQGTLGNRFNERASVGCDGLAGADPPEYAVGLFRRARGNTWSPMIVYRAALRSQKEWHPDVTNRLERTPGLPSGTFGGPRGS
jgi:hypothetical protein